MKILETKSAPNPRRVRIFLAEKGIKIAYEELDFEKDLKSPRFTFINKLQRVPVLVLDDGTAITESIAICRYFEELQPEPALFGKGPLGRALVEMWNRRMELGLLACVAQAFRHLHPAMKGREVPQVPEWGEANKPKAIEMMHLMDEELGKHRFLAGNDYSVADITALVGIDFARAARVSRPADLKHLARWHEEVSARPSAKA